MPGVPAGVGGAQKVGRSVGPDNSSYAAEHLTLCQARERILNRPVRTGGRG